MKKLQITITTKKEGKVKTVDVFVDEETARVLDQLNDEDYKQQYLYEEYLMQEREKSYHRKTVSLDAIIENGDEPCSDTDLLDDMIKKEELHKAIKMLDPIQQEIVRRIYFDGEKQCEIAKELGITKASMSERMKYIKERLKSFLKNF